jgi:hypothetical protein
MDCVPLDKPMHKWIPAILRVLVLAMLPMWALGQTAPEPTATKAPDTSAQIHQSPYTAQFKLTTVRKLPDGTGMTTQSTMIEAMDSQGRRMVSNTEASATADQQMKTQIQVADPVNHTLSYWAVPGTTAQVVNAPDVGVDTDCSRKMRAIDPLHPVSLETSRGEQLPIADLGTKTIQGIEVRGGRVTFTPTFVPRGASGAIQRTNELWIAVDRALGGLRVIEISTTTGQSETFTKELTSFAQSEPDHKLFQLPAGRQITTKNGMQYYCGVRPGQPSTATAAPR